MVVDANFVRCARGGTLSGRDLGIDQAGFGRLCTLLGGLGGEELGRSNTLDFDRLFLSFLEHRADERGSLFLIDGQCLFTDAVTHPLNENVELALRNRLRSLELYSHARTD